MPKFFIQISPALIFLFLFFDEQVDVEMDPPIFIMESINNESKQPRSRTRTIENELTLKEKEE